MTMSPVAPANTSDLNRMLGASISSLDITRFERHQVVARYELLGQTLNEHWSDSRGHNQVYPQGSFALGTVTRRIHRADDVDIDLVVLRGIQRSSTSQLELKVDTGAGLRKFVRSPLAKNPLLEESDRCWTLQYPGMHMDVLPSIPDDSVESSFRDGILITDHDVRHWLNSNPLGYAEWFHGVAQEEVRFKKAFLAERVEITDVPDWSDKTTLQLVVQALKRHRDIYFTGRLERRPSSVIITTLAAHAYSYGDNLFDVLRSIVGKLTEQIQYVDGVYVISNPVLPEENFADYWEKEPWRVHALFEWVDAVTKDVNAIAARRGNHRVLEGITSAFGSKAALAGAHAVSQPLVSARQAGNLRIEGGSGSLLLAGGTTTNRPVRNHDFHGGSRR